MGNFLKYLAKKHQELGLILAITTILRILLAASIELGNDEAYYWTYVKYPDISHFDHPPLLGFLAQLFTFNLLWDSEVALRLSAIVCGFIGTILIYLITLEIRSKRAAIYAAWLFSASLYTSIIASLFLMPDNPLVVCWLWAIYLMIKLFSNRTHELDSQKLLLLGLVIGFACLSKYQGAFLASGFFMTVFTERKHWLTKPSLYLSFLLAFVVASPILWWNWDHDFVSFGFHSKRVGFFEKGIRFDYFFSELFGELFYNNPIIVFLIVFAIIRLKKGRWKLKKPYQRLLFNLSWPLIGLVLFFALFRRTLPHWTGPAYLSLMVVAAVYLSYIKMSEARKWLLPILSFAFIVSQLGALEINRGIITHSTQVPGKNVYKVGKYDVTLDMFGWQAFKTAFDNYLEEHEDNSYQKLALVSQDLYQSAHLDYYVARPLDKKLIAFGPLEATHKYAWINRERGLLNRGETALFITHSRAYKSAELFEPYFKEVKLVEKIPIYRNGHLAQFFFIYYLDTYKGNYRFPEVKL